MHDPITHYSKRMELFVAFAILLAVIGAQEIQLKGPENTLSVAGSNVTLKCSSPSRYCNGTEWLKYGGIPPTVFDDHGIMAFPYRDRFSVDHSSGCDLIIKSVELTDAGRFICRAFTSSKSIERTAHLVVLTTQPKCTINASMNDIVEGDRVQLTCEVTYNGTDHASMVWNGVEDAPAAVESGKTIRRSYSVVTSAFKVPPFTCNTSFVVKTMESGSSEVIKGMATNMPVTSCETPVIRVMYSVRDVQLSPSLSSYPPGSSITCSAKGYPSPTFNWQKLEDDNVTWVDIPNLTGNKFILNDSSSNYWYRCVAMNNVRDINYNNTSDEFQINNTSNDEITLLTPTLMVSVGALVCVGILLLLIMVLVVCFCARCCPGYRCLNAEKKSNNNVAQNIIDHEIIIDHEMRSPSSHQRSAMNLSIPITQPPLVEEQDAYARLGQNRDANEYASIGKNQKAKRKKKS